MARYRTQDKDDTIQYDVRRSLELPIPTNTYCRMTTTIMKPNFCLRFVLTVIVLPFVFTCVALWNYLTFGECMLIGGGGASAYSNGSDAAAASSELYCERFAWHVIIPPRRSSASSQNKTRVEMQSKTSSSMSTTTLPSIAVLTSEWIMPASSNGDGNGKLNPIPPKWFQSIIHQYEQEGGESSSSSFGSFTSGTTSSTTTSTLLPSNLQDFTSYKLRVSSNQNGKGKFTGGDTTTSYGFRKNPNKPASSPKIKKQWPLTTILLVGVNGVVFLWLQTQSAQIQSTVALDSRYLYQDYGRAISGNLSHIQSWHLLLNMMSLTTLGPILEDSTEHYGSIGLLLYTISFLGLQTILVVLLSQLWVWVNQKFRQQSVSSSFNMIGFSGILFVYMVVVTLEGPKTCPIFFMPDLCFDTFEVWGGWKFSLGPLVQLVVLQFLLPRASFLGHLAGIVLGFIWHWQGLPRLEYIQPCILFPFLWMIGKRQQQQTAQEVDKTNEWRHNITYHGNNANSEWKCKCQKLLQRLLVLHCLALIVFYFLHSPDDFGWGLSTMINSQILSEMLIGILIFSGWFIALRDANDDGKDNYRYMHGYVGLITTIWVTDSMTLSGWIMTYVLWNRQSTIVAICLMMSRWILWLLIMLWVVAVAGSPSSHDPYDNTEENQPVVGVCAVLEWAIVEPCREIILIFGQRRLQPGLIVGTIQRIFTALLSPSSPPREERRGSSSPQKSKRMNIVALLSSHDHSAEAVHNSTDGEETNGTASTTHLI